ncbi:MAG: pyridoxamine 5'-phosphate oxidase family protein [Bacteroidia bacterium]|nr:pyridoxamine 5'-phosphate oxidase family protein [Bacteroidia bacterium]
MGKRQKKLSSKLISFIKEQPVFFVATAMKEGRINLSPKGLDSLKVLSETQVVWLNLTGSGNETATHLQFHNRMTLMFCAFEGNPMILRLYGKAQVYHERDTAWQDLQPHFPDAVGSRQFIVLDIDLVQTSCGFGVPYMEYKGERDLLGPWAAEKGRKGLEKYWVEKNVTSLDGHATGIF